MAHVAHLHKPQQMYDLIFSYQLLFSDDTEHETRTAGCTITLVLQCFSPFHHITLPGFEEAGDN